MASRFGIARSEPPGKQHRRDDHRDDYREHDRGRINEDKSFLAADGAMRVQ